MSTPRVACGLAAALWAVVCVPALGQRVRFASSLPSRAPVPSSSPEPATPSSEPAASSSSEPAASWSAEPAPSVSPEILPTSPLVTPAPGATLQGTIQSPAVGWDPYAAPIASPRGLFSAAPYLQFGPPSRLGGLYAGFAFVIAKPHITQNSAYEQATYDAGSNTYIYETEPFGFDYKLAPRVWVGYAGYGGLGVRCRYWQFDYAGDSVHLEDADAFDDHLFMGKAKIPCNEPKWYLDGGFADVTYGLELHAVDFEATQQIDFWAASIILNCGIRYARVVQDYHVIGEDVLNDLFEFNTGHIFEGVGPTFGLEARRPIGSRGLALYGITRGSVLLGEADAYIRTATPQAPQVFVPRGSQHSYSGDDVIGVYEGQIGLEWAPELRPGAPRLVLRAAYEGQLWVGIGAPNNAECGAPLGFQGFTFVVGLNR